MPEVVAVPASTVLLVRRRAEWEVLMVERPARGVFGGIWVFPGGAVDPIDHDPTVYGFDDPWRAAALRETAEEVGIFLTTPPLGPVDRGGRPVTEVVAEAGAAFAPDRLRFISRFVTPVGVPRRFDTHFYLAEAPDDAEAVVADGELVDLAWVTPGDALERGRSKEWNMIFPTIHHLRLLAAADDPLTVEAQPERKVVIVDGRPRFADGSA